jgi:hypothetical protein
VSLFIATVAWGQKLVLLGTVEMLLPPWKVADFLAVNCNIRNVVHRGSLNTVEIRIPIPMFAILIKQLWR